MDAGEDRLEVDVLFGVAIRGSERLSVGGHGAILCRAKERKGRENNRINFPSGEHNIYRIRRRLGALAAVYSAGRCIHLLKDTSNIILGPRTGAT